MNKKINIVIAMALALAITSCAPKAGVLRSPDYKGTGTVHPNKTNNTSSEGKTEEVLKGESQKANAKKFAGKNITLMLPFQLDQISSSSVIDKDVKRSALALDFYQGFELGLEELAKNGANFNLNVLDSRDNTVEVASLAKSEPLQEASIIIGPVYPQEIKTFGANYENKNVLQINPLAAAMPTEFNLPNLVSITPPIKAHTNAIANKVGKSCRTGDVIIVFNTSDGDSRQFLGNMMSSIKQSNETAKIVSVSTLAQLNENLSLTGTNYVVSGTTDKTQLKNLVTNLIKKYSENFYSINLFGHPLWDRYDFSSYGDFASLNPTITTESNLKNWSSTVKKFKENYNTSFGVNPSDASYKGYDVAMYFGGLINKYGADNIKDKLVSEKYTGIYNSYDFRFNENWGFANESVYFKQYRSGSFQLQ